MSEKLLESEFFTVKTSIWAKSTDDVAGETNTTSNEAPPVEGSNVETSATTAPTTLEGWGDELKKRLEANRKLSAEAREPEAEIESKFFKEFFSANWDEGCAKQLILIDEPLRKLLRVVGFNQETNPILAFLLLPYVKDKLLRAGLINLNTFKAVYNAFIKKTIADSQFYKENAYNILYCASLYKKSAKEIEEYLTLQKQILSPTATKYTAEHQIRNRKIFFKIFNEPDINKQIAALKELPISKLPDATKGAELNSIDMAKALANKMGLTSTVAEVSLDSKEMTTLVDKLDTVSKKLAAILALSISTDSPEAKKAITSDKFKSVDMRELVMVASQLTSILPKGKLAKKDADAIVVSLLSKI